MRDIFSVRFWLGRTTVLASVAVLLAAAGGAYAATSSSGSDKQSAARTTSHGPFATAKGAPFVAAAAVVNPNGSLARSVGVKSARGDIFVPGTYQVLFTHNVNRCAFEATLGDTGVGPAPDGQIGVATRSHHKNGVYIETYDSSGSTVPQPFHLVVIC